MTYDVSEWQVHLSAEGICVSVAVVLLLLLLLLLRLRLLLLLKMHCIDFHCEQQEQLREGMYAVNKQMNERTGEDRQLHKQRTEHTNKQPDLSLTQGMSWAKKKARTMRSRA